MTDVPRVHLRALRSSDIEFFYDAACDPAVGPTWRYRGTTPAPDLFMRHLWEGVLCQYVVADGRTREPLGLVALYNANLQSGFAYLSVLTARSALETGLSLLGAAQLLEKAFSLWHLRKVYLEIPEFNLDRVHSLVSRFLVEEGRLRDHECLWGRSWDHVIFALYKETWEKNAHRVLPSSRAANDQEAGPDPWHT